MAFGFKVNTTDGVTDTLNTRSALVIYRDNKLAEPSGIINLSTDPLATLSNVDASECVAAAIPNDGNTPPTVTFPPTGNFDLTSPISVPGFGFRSDGSSIYTCDNTNGKILRFTLSDNWNVASRSYDSEWTTPSSMAFPLGVFFKPDGTRVYVCGGTSGGSNSVIQATLSTAWDITTAGSVVQYTPFVGSGRFVRDIYFSSSGTEMFILNNVGTVYEFSLSVAWSLASASASANYAPSSLPGGSEAGLAFNASGTKMFITGTSDFVFEYDLGTAWSVSTASYNSVSYDTGKLTSSLFGVRLGDSDEKMFLLDLAVSNILSIDLPTAGALSGAGAFSLAWKPPANYLGAYTPSTDFDLVVFYCGSAGLIT